MYLRWDLISRGLWDSIYNAVPDDIPDIIGGFTDVFAAEEIMEPFFVSEYIMDIQDIHDIYTAAGSAESVSGSNAVHDILSTVYGGPEALFDDFGTTLSPAEALSAALFIKEGGLSGEVNSFMTDTDIGDAGAFVAEYMPQNVFNDGVDPYGRWDTYESASPLQLAKLREAAEEDEAGKRSAAEISINLGGITNNVSSEVDLDSIVEYLEENLYEAMSVAAESIHS